MKKVCKNCDYYVNKYGYGQCYGQKNAPRVDDYEHCEDWKEYSGKEEKTMTDKIKQAVADEFKYRASQGKTDYSVEEVIYIVNEVIDEVAFDENEVESQKQPHDVDMQIRIIKGDLKYLSEKIDKLSSRLNEQKIER